MREVVCCYEVREVRSQLIMAVAEEAFDGGLLNRTANPFDLSVGPGMVGLGHQLVHYPDGETSPSS